MLGAPIWVAEHVAHLVVVGAGVGLGGEVAALPAPVGPGAGEAVEDLAGGGLAGEALGLGQLGELRLVGDRAPEEGGDALLADALQGDGDAGLAEVLLRQHVGGDLAPVGGDLEVVEGEDDRAVGVADLGGGGAELKRPVGPGLLGGEAAVDLHVLSLASCLPALVGAPTRCCAPWRADHQRTPPAELRSTKISRWTCQILVVDSASSHKGSLTNRFYLEASAACLGACDLHHKPLEIRALRGATMLGQSGWCRLSGKCCASRQKPA